MASVLCPFSYSRLRWKNCVSADTPEVIESRIAKAEYELSFAPKFDAVIVNDDLETAKAAALKVITQFLNQ